MLDPLYIVKVCFTAEVIAVSHFLYYSTNSLWQWSKVNPKTIITFNSCMRSTDKFSTKAYYDHTAGISMFIVIVLFEHTIPDDIDLHFSLL